MVAEAYRQPKAANKRFYVHGPEALTVPEALRSYCRALHPEIERLRRVPYWQIRLVAWLQRNREMRVGVNMVSYLENVGERGDSDEANTLLGAPQVTLDQWLRLQQTDQQRDDNEAILL